MYCAALLSLCKSRDQIREYLFILAMALQAERLIETGKKYEILCVDCFRPPDMS